MQNNNSFFMVHQRPCILVLFIFALAISPLMVIDEARAANITFSEYPVGTTITDQYLNSGVVFSGQPLPPIIALLTDYGVNDPALKADYNSGSMIISFVDPTDGTPVEASYVRFYSYWSFWLGSVMTYTYYDINGGIISQEEYPLAIGVGPPLNIPPKFHKLVITPDGLIINYMIDSLSFAIPPKITLSRLDLMTIQATGTPAGGTFAYNVALTAGANPPTISFINGYTNTTNPNEAQLVDPKNLDHKGQPTAGGLSNITATYSLNGNTAQESFSVPTFGMSCYYTALESDWGTPPKNCSRIRIFGITYSGTTTNPYGYPGTYCSAFIADVAILQGNGVLNSGQKIQYINGTLVNVDVIKGSDGTPVVAGQTVARDRDKQKIIPSTGVFVTVDKINNNNPLLANDIGGEIKGYRLDLYNGVGKSVCNGFNNVISVGACNPAQPACPSMDN